MSEKVAVVTGASRGIGAACSKALAEQGYRIAVHYRSGEELAKELSAKLPNSEIFQADLSREDECKNFIKNVNQIWVN